ncbi:MAG: transglycosylase SLT domain-containing protein, partial [Synergistaceae bacterium]|nr:transglycosylase SLT domain-containing protein [Synergistaceae bacterium]
DLYNANDNIKLGTSHLGWLGKNFAKKEYVMAAYNAGSGNARKWLKTVGERADLPQWIEAVKFEETNGYVQRVSANLAIYRLLYDDGK